MDNKFFIYGLTDITGQIRYIGATNNTETRLEQHLKDDSDSPKAQWIRDLLLKGDRPRLVILEETTEDRAREKEQWWVNFYSNLGLLLNSAKPTYHAKALTQNKSITIRISDSLLNEIKRIAMTKHMNYQSLIKLWLSEKAPI